MSVTNPRTWANGGVRGGVVVRILWHSQTIPLAPPH
jgi:hypothetical protein